MLYYTHKIFIILRTLIKIKSKLKKNKIKYATFQADTRVVKQWTPLTDVGRNKTVTIRAMVSNRDLPLSSPNKDTHIVSGVTS